jgi:segregation and condensation protein A
MAATLMYIKSRELLPVDQQAEVEDEDEGDDPRWELVRRLVEYKKFKDAAARLQEKEALQENVFPRIPGKLEFAATSPGPAAGVSVFDLISAVGNILKRLQTQDPSRDVFEDKWTVSQKIEHLMALTRERPRLKFTELFEGQTSRMEIVTTFLALLELIRLRVLTALQDEPFSEIEIGAMPQAVPASNGSAPVSDGGGPAS